MWKKVGQNHSEMKQIANRRSRAVVFAASLLTFRFHPFFRTGLRLLIPTCAPNTFRSLRYPCDTFFSRDFRPLSSISDFVVPIDLKCFLRRFECLPFR